MNTNIKQVLVIATVALAAFAGIMILSQDSEAADAGGFSASVSGSTLTFTCTSTGTMPDYDDWPAESKAAVDAARSTITTIVFPLGESTITSIGADAFKNFTALTEFEVPASVKTVNPSAFNGCTILTSITVNPANDSMLSSGGILYTMDKMFPDDIVRCPEGFSGSVDVEIGTKSIGGFAFSGCTKVTGIIMPETVTSIGEKAFSGCSLITTIEIPNSVISIGSGVFEGMSKLENISANTSNYISESGVLYQKTGSSTYTLVKCPSASKGIGTNGRGYNTLVIKLGTTVISDYAFEGSIIDRIEFVQTITSIGAHAFDSSSLDNAYLPAGLSSIGEYAFNNCTDLHWVSMPGIDLTAGHEFAGCDNLSVLYTQGPTDDTTFTVRTNSFSETTPTPTPWQVWEKGSSAWRTTQTDNDLTFSVDDSGTGAGTHKLYGMALYSRSTAYMTGKEWYDINMNEKHSYVISGVINSHNLQAVDGVWFHILNLDNTKWVDQNTSTQQTGETPIKIMDSDNDGFIGVMTIKVTGETWINMIDHLIMAVFNGVDVVLPEGMDNANTFSYFGNSDNSVVNYPNSLTKVGSALNSSYNGVTIYNKWNNFLGFSSASIKYLQIEDGNELLKLIDGIVYTKLDATKGWDADGNLNASRTGLDTESIIAPYNLGKMTHNGYTAFNPKNIQFGEQPVILDRFGTNDTHNVVYTHMVSVDVNRSWVDYKHVDIVYYPNTVEGHNFPDTFFGRIYNDAGAGGSTLGKWANAFVMPRDFEAILPLPTKYSPSDTSLYYLKNVRFVDADGDDSTELNLAETGIIGGHLYYQKSTLKAKGSVNDDLDWYILGETLIIKGHGEIPDYDVGKAPWNSYIADGTVQSILTFEGVTKIGENAFNTGAKNSVKEINLGSGLLTIGSKAFSGCQFTGLYIPDSVTSISVDSFRDCDRLEQFVCYDNTTYITEDGALYMASSKDLFIIPEGKTSISVLTGSTKILDEAGYNSSLAYIDVSGMTSIGKNAFYNSKLTSIELGPITVGNYAFANTLSMQVAVIDGLSIMSEGLFNDSAVQRITIADSAIEVRQYAIPYITWYKDGYEPVIISPSNIDTAIEKGHIYTRTAAALKICSAGGESGDKSLQYYIDYVDNKPQLHIVFTGGSGVFEDYTDGGAPWYAVASVLSKIELPVGMTTVGDYAFQDTTDPGSSNINLPSTVLTVGQSAFKGSVVKSIDLSRVRALGASSFEGCAQLTEIVTSDLITTIPESAFKGCAGLTQVTLGQGVETLGANAFDGCSSLGVVLATGQSTSSITMVSSSLPASVWYKNGSSDAADQYTPGTDPFVKGAIYTKTAGSIAGAGIGLYHATDVTYKVIGTALLISGNSSTGKLEDNVMRDFSANSDVVRETWTNVTTIMLVDVYNLGDNCFKGLNKVTSINFGKTVSIGSGAFSGCTALTAVILPDDVTRVESGAFEGCTSLKKVDFGSDIQYIGAGILKGTGLPTVYKAGNEVGVIDTEFLEYTPIVSEAVLDNYLLDRETGYSQKAVMLIDLWDAGSNKLVTDSNKVLDLNGKIIQSQSTVFDPSGNPAIEDSDSKGNTFVVFDKQWTLVDYDKTGYYTAYFKGGAVINGSTIYGATQATIDGTTTDPSYHQLGYKTLGYYMNRAVVELDQTSFVYDGTAKSPEIKSVMIDGMYLKPFVSGSDVRDYDVTLSNNINPGQGSLTLASRLNSSISITIPFEITGPIKIQASYTLNGVIAPIESVMDTLEIPSKVQSDGSANMYLKPDAGYTLSIKVDNALIQSYADGIYTITPTRQMTDGSFDTITITVNVVSISSGVKSFNVMMLTDSNNGALIQIESPESSGGLLEGTLKLYGVKYRVTADGLIAYSSIDLTDFKNVGAGDTKVQWNPTLGNVGSTEDKYAIYYVYAVYEYSDENGTNRLVSEGKYGYSPTLNDTP